MHVPWPSAATTTMGVLRPDSAGEASKPLPRRMVNSKVRPPPVQPVKLQCIKQAECTRRLMVDTDT